MRSKPLKVLRMIARLNIGGPAIHTILLTRYLNNSDFKSWLIAGKLGADEGNMDYLIPNSQFPLIYFQEMGREISPWKDFLALRKTIRFIRKEKPSIIHTHTAKAGFIGRAAALWVNLFRDRKIKIVHTFHGHVFSGYFSPLKTKVFLAIERFLGKRTDAIITITEKQQKEILDYRVGTPQNHRLVPLGLELEKFIKTSRKRGLFREELNFPENLVVVGTVTRLVPIKNIRLLIQVAAKLSKKHDNLRFVIVGDGEEKDFLMELTKRNGVEDKVIFCGFRKDLENIYSDLDLFVLTSLNEGSPVALIEAMSVGVPSICSNVGGVADVMKNIHLPVLCESQSVDDFVHKVERFLNHREEYETKFQEERKSVMDQYGYNRLLRDMSRLYEELVA